MASVVRLCGSQSEGHVARRGRLHSAGVTIEADQLLAIVAKPARSGCTGRPQRIERRPAVCDSVWFLRHGLAQLPTSEPQPSVYWLRAAGRAVCQPEAEVPSPQGAFPRRDICRPSCKPGHPVESQPDPLSRLPLKKRGARGGVAAALAIGRRGAAGGQAGDAGARRSVVRRDSQEACWSPP